MALCVAHTAMDHGISQRQHHQQQQQPPFGSSSSEIKATTPVSSSSSSTSLSFSSLHYQTTQHNNEVPRWSTRKLSTGSDGSTESVSAREAVLFHAHMLNPKPISDPGDVSSDGATSNTMISRMSGVANGSEQQERDLKQTTTTTTIPGATANTTPPPEHHDDGNSPHHHGSNNSPPIADEPTNVSSLTLNDNNNNNSTTNGELNLTVPNVFMLNEYEGGMGNSNGPVVEGGSAPAPHMASSQGYRGNGGSSNGNSGIGGLRFSGVFFPSYTEPTLTPVYTHQSSHSSNESNGSYYVQAPLSLIDNQQQDAAANPGQYLQQQRQQQQLQPQYQQRRGGERKRQKAGQQQRKDDDPADAGDVGEADVAAEADHHQHQPSQQQPKRKRQRPLSAMSSVSGGSGMRVSLSQPYPSGGSLRSATSSKKRKRNTTNASNLDEPAEYHEARAEVSQQQQQPHPTALPPPPVVLPPDVGDHAHHTSDDIEDVKPNVFQNDRILIITEQPSHHGRFRYRAEGRQNSLPGRRKGAFPTVAVHPAYRHLVPDGTLVRVRIVTRQDGPNGELIPHWHTLEGKNGEDTSRKFMQGKAVFPNLVVKRQRTNVRHPTEDTRAIRLHFFIDYEQDGRTKRAGVVSDAVFSTQLVIDKLSHESGYADRRVSVIILTSKFQRKSISIKITDTRPIFQSLMHLALEDGWVLDSKGFPTFQIKNSEIHTHHQFAVQFEMPRFWTQNLETPHVVEITLVDLLDQISSDPAYFTYLPAGHGGGGTGQFAQVMATTSASANAMSVLQFAPPPPQQQQQQPQPQQQQQQQQRQQSAGVMVSATNIDAMTVRSPSGESIFIPPTHLPDGGVSHHHHHHQQQQQQQQQPDQHHTLTHHHQGAHTQATSQQHQLHQQVTGTSTMPTTQSNVVVADSRALDLIKAGQVSLRHRRQQQLQLRSLQHQQQQQQGPEDQEHHHHA